MDQTSVLDGKIKVIDLVEWGTVKSVKFCKRFVYACVMRGKERR